MPRITEQDPEQLVALEERPDDQSRPVVKAYVIYMGANPHKSVTLRGRLYVDHLGEDLESAAKEYAEANGLDPKKDLAKAKEAVLAERPDLKEARKETVKRAVMSQNTTYNFEAVGTDRRKLPKNRYVDAKMVAGIPDAAVLVGKRVEVVEHLDHIARFRSDPELYEPKGKDGRPVFRILATPENMRTIQVYIQQQTARRRRTDNDFAQISQSA